MTRTGFGKSNRVPCITLALCFLAVASSAEGQPTPTACRFPWTITATPAGASSLAIHFCGIFAGCFPHAPEFSINGPEIRVTYHGGEFPNRCSCLTVVDDFRGTVVVGPIVPGEYTVTVMFENCTVLTELGTGVVRFEPSAAIPGLDYRGLALFALLLAASAMWRLSR